MFTIDCSAVLRMLKAQHRTDTLVIFFIFIFEAYAGKAISNEVFEEWVRLRLSLCSITGNLCQA